MDSLVRKALLGDKKSQEECTEKGIVLPCPFCGNENNIISNWGMFRVWCPHCKAKSEDTLTTRDALKSWNTRPAPPVGKCKDCGKQSMCCLRRGSCGENFKDDDFCNYFEPKEEDQ